VVIEKRILHNRSIHAIFGEGIDDQAPMLISCDAHHIPFLPNSFQFVFAYQTLHHFENPIPVLAECYRVLGKGGYLFFNEEPMDSRFRRFLRGKRILSHPPTRMQQLGHHLGVEKIFWDDGNMSVHLV
jgi:SAM-dependent methyltransferase